MEKAGKFERGFFLLSIWRIPVLAVPGYVLTTISSRVYTCRLKFQQAGMVEGDNIWDFTWTEEEVKYSGW
jgi:hypothetical protein